MATVHRSAALSAGGSVLALVLIAGSVALGSDLQQLAQAGGGTASSRDEAAIGQSTPAFSSNPTPALGSPTPAFGSTTTPAFDRSPASAFGSGTVRGATVSGRADAIVSAGERVDGMASATARAAATAGDGIAARASVSTGATRTSSDRSVTAEGRASVGPRGGEGMRDLRATQQTDAVEGAGSADFRILSSAPATDREAPAFVITNDGSARMPAGALRSGTITLP